MRTELLHLLKTTQTTAVLVTHDHEEAFAMADYVAVLNNGKLEQCSAPETMYHLPVSPFVAEFVGQADFIPGTIRDSVVVTQLGTFPVPHGYRGGPEVVVMIRPDDVHIRESGNGDGTVESRQFRGSEIIYGIRLDSGDFVHSSEASTRFFPLDSKVELEVIATHTVLFDRKAWTR
jgi:iron(III) transport system ATP-binding protein